jgi:predicted acetyltransferase
MSDSFEHLKLVKANIALKDVFLAYCRAFQAAGEPPAYGEELAFEDFPCFVKQLQDQELGIGLPANYVPSAHYWLVGDHNTVLGDSNLRFSLTPDLEDLGGHIGYRINPLERRKGYGKYILKLTLEKARERGLADVLVTCDPSNTGSAKIIQSNGGVLASQSYSQKWARKVSRYWIRL